MDIPDDELIPTRATLIHRLKDWQDQASWQDFFDTYWQLIYNVAVQRGVTRPEAQDVVQEVMAAVAKHMPGFKYDPAIGSFKAWLLKLTRWRIIDHQRKHSRPVAAPAVAEETGLGDGKMTGSLNLVMPDLDHQWDAAWEKNLLAAAIAKARRRMDPKQYQIYDCHVNKEWAAERVAKAFGVPINQVYLAKHRVTEMIKAEAARLLKEVI